MRKILLLLLCLMATGSFACSTLKEPTLEEWFAQADHVVLARILSTRLVIDETKELDWERQTVEAKYEVLETFKGDNSPPVARESVWGPGNCTMGLLSGNMYVLFLSGPDRMVAGLGSFMSWNVEGKVVQPELEELRSLKDKHR